MTEERTNLKKVEWKQHILHRTALLDKRDAACTETESQRFEPLRAVRRTVPKIRRSINRVFLLSPPSPAARRPPWTRARR